MSGPFWGCACLGLSLLGTSLADALPGGAAGPAGTWAGSFQILGQDLPCTVRLRQGNGGLEGEMNVPAQILRIRLSDIRWDPPTLCFRADLGNADLEGRLEGDVVSGRISQGVLAKGDFRLQRVAIQEVADPSKYEDYVGDYGSGKDAVTVSREGEFLLVGKWEMFPAGEGAFRVLDAQGVTEFSFLRGAEGKVDRLEARLGDRAKVLARQAAPFSQREVRFRNGAVELSGTLYAPLGKGPFPAVAMVHGSGAASRRVFAGLGRHFASKGIALLAHDKRGAGCSTGDWTRASYEDLAGDALAAVAALRSIPGVDPDRVGLAGISQGGWIIPIAASSSRDVAFAVLLSAPAVSGRSQFLTNTRGTLESAKLSRTDIDQGMALADLLLRTAADDAHRPELEAAIRKSGGERWFRAALPLDTQPLDAVLAQLRAAGLDRDPVPALEKTRCPVLAVWGGADSGVPPAENRPAMEEAFRKGGNTRVTFKVYPGANHGLQMPDGKTAPGLLETMEAWILSLPGQTK